MREIVCGVPSRSRLRACFAFRAVFAEHLVG
jgi:hypothetical protein